MLRRLFDAKRDFLACKEPCLLREVRSARMVDWLDDSNPETPLAANVASCEWARLERTFATLGFREGTAAGEEAALQAAFNAGFGEGSAAGEPEGAVLGAVATLIEVLPMVHATGVARDAVLARLCRVRQMLLDKHDPALCTSQEQGGGCCQRQVPSAIGEPTGGCGTDGCCQRQALPLPPQHPTPSFIDSPFNTKVEYEAWLNTPVPVNQQRVLDAAGTREVSLSRGRLNILDWARREVHDVQCILLCGSESSAARVVE
jgi:hypothetical protein